MAEHNAHTLEQIEYLREKIRETKRKGYRYLQRGLLVLAFCLLAAQLSQLWVFPFSNFITESVLIAGWVALWRPIEIFLYTLPDLRESLARKHSQLRREYK